MVLIPALVLRSLLAAPPAHTAPERQIPDGST